MAGPDACIVPPDHRPTRNALPWTRTSQHPPGSSVSLLNPPGAHSLRSEEWELRMGTDPAVQRSQAQAVSNAMTKMHRESYGRGPNSVRTVMGHDHVICFLEDLYTPVERTLLDGGEVEAFRSEDASRKLRPRPELGPHRHGPRSRHLLPRGPVHAGRAHPARRRRGRGGPRDATRVPAHDGDHVPRGRRGDYRSYGARVPLPGDLRPGHLGGGVRRREGRLAPCAGRDRVGAGLFSPHAGKRRPRGDTRAVELLRCASDLIRRGWTQHAESRDAAGAAVDPWQPSA